MFEFNENTKIMFNGLDEESSFVQNQVCQKCGLTLVEFLRSGIVGCANCYKIFENEVRTKLLQKQGSINHVGKVSVKHSSKVKVKEMIAQLEIEKEKAAEAENYILAEDYKNRIEKLKGEL